MTYSAFTNNGIQKTIDLLTKEIQELYLSDYIPWVVGYSGGKDSSATLQLVWNAISELPVEKRIKEIHVISTNTLVENPIVALWQEKSLKLMANTAKQRDLPILPHRLTPATKDTFWVKVADITRLDRQLAEATRDNEQSHLAARRRITAINIEKALNALNGILVQRVKDSVTAEISQTLGKITDSYMDGEITPEFRYNIYRNDSGHRAPLAPSDGQKQIASLVFIASLIKIARQNMEDHHTNSFMRGGEYPLVMDAPFSAADDVYAPRTAEFLTQTTQEVIMTNPGQLRIFENAIRPYVGAEYLIVKHENNVLDQQLLTLPTGDRKALRKQIEGNQYSTIEEV